MTGKFHDEDLISLTNILVAPQRAENSFFVLGLDSQLGRTQPFLKNRKIIYNNLITQNK